MNDLRGYVAVVTGGNSGIGLGMATGIAKAGGDVAIWSRRADRNAEAVDQLRALGVRAEGVECDVSDPAQIDNAMAETLMRLGKVDALFANAGRGGRGTKFLDVSIEEWRAVMAVNLDGLMLCLQAGARHMADRGEGGALVAVSSTSAIHGAANNEAYGASKTAVLGLVRALAVGLARHRIRVNAISPGWTISELSQGGYDNDKFRNITTGRTPVRRWAEASEFESVGAYLADPRLGFHTGDNLVVDGGYTIF